SATGSTPSATAAIVMVTGTSGSYDDCIKLHTLGNTRCIEAFKEKPYNPEGPNAGDCSTQSAAYADRCIKAVEQDKLFSYTFTYPAPRPDIGAIVKSLGCADPGVFTNCTTTLAADIEALDTDCTSQIDRSVKSRSLAVPLCACAAAAKYRTCLLPVCKPEALKLQCSAVTEEPDTPAATSTTGAPAFAFQRAR
ncbi:hypothetical protein HDU96_004687, partial [Phlyctochytrium bullatum]